MYIGICCALKSERATDHNPATTKYSSPTKVDVVELRDWLVANYARLHRRLHRHLGCTDDASDCLHDAWLRLGETRIPEVVQNPEAYLFRVACNAANDRLRASRPWLLAGGEAGTELEYIADPSPGPELVAEARSELAAVDRAMRHMPLRHRSILLGLRVHELTRDEIALRHGLSLRRVDTALRQALALCCATGAALGRYDRC